MLGMVDFFSPIKYVIFFLSMQNAECTDTVRISAPKLFNSDLIILFQ